MLIYISAIYLNCGYDLDWDRFGYRICVNFWLFFIGSFLCLLSSICLLKQFLIRLIRRQNPTHGDGYKCLRRKDQINNWKVIFSKLPLMDAFIGFIFCTLLLTYWIVFNLEFGAIVSRTRFEAENISVMNIFAWNDDSDKVIVFTSKMILCLFVLSSLLLVKSILIKSSLTKMYLDDYLQNVKNLLRMRDYLRIIMDCKDEDIFSPNLDTFLLQTPINCHLNNWNSNSKSCKICVGNSDPCKRDIHIPYPVSKSDKKCPHKRHADRLHVNTFCLRANCFANEQDFQRYV